MPEVKSLKYAVAHDMCLIDDRSPLGAVPIGSSVRLRLRVEHAVRPDISHVDLLIRENGTCRSVPMAPCDDGYIATVELGPQPHVAFYVFNLTFLDGSRLSYVPCIDGRSTTGQVVCADVDGEWDVQGWAYSNDLLRERPTGDLALANAAPGFQITVYDPAFTTPDWFAGSVMYQIFPDRFARGRGGVREPGLSYHKSMKRPVILHESWNEPVAWLGDAPNKEKSPSLKAADEEAVLKARMKSYDPIDFYGGTLAGIKEKLPYLASLGVEVLYLNPIFEARSNHRYDTADYEHVESLLGSDEDFALLAEEAEQNGISIVLDAVLSHTGADSRYFNAYGSYDLPGATQGQESPCHSWYDFSDQENGAPYRCWWGDPTLPEVNERDASWQRYMLGDPDSPTPDCEPSRGAAIGGILPKWISAGARGYRLDVADELPDDVLHRIRHCVKCADPQAAIIGEVWEDATNKESYGVARDYALGTSLDSVMNYPLRNAILGFAIGKLDAWQFTAFLKTQQSNYPPPLYRCLMNLLSSHDVERLRSVLSLKGPLKGLTRDKQVLAVSEITPEQDEMGSRLQRIAAALQYALPGVPCLYYGDERGLNGGGDPFCRATFPWDAPDDERSDYGLDLTSYYREIGTLRKGSQVLREGDMACMAPDSDVVCIARSLPERHALALIAVNRSSSDVTVTLDLQARELGLDPRLLDVACGATCFDANEDGIVSFTVPALDAQFFQL